MIGKAEAPKNPDILRSETKNTFYLIMKGLKNAYFMPFLWLSK